MKVSEDDEIQFWWPCVISYFDASVAFSTIWVTISETFGLRKTLRPGMVFLDAGTHSSVHAILAAKKLSHRGTVVAFEPSSAGYRTKFRSTDILESARCHDAALGYQTREMMLMLGRCDFDWFDVCADGSLIYLNIRNCVALPKEKCAMG
jgi:hypothetical protein